MLTYQQWGYITTVAFNTGHFHFGITKNIQKNYTLNITTSPRWQRVKIQLPWLNNITSDFSTTATVKPKSYTLDPSQKTLLARQTGGQDDRHCFEQSYFVCDFINKNSNMARGGTKIYQNKQTTCYIWTHPEVMSFFFRIFVTTQLASGRWSLCVISNMIYENFWTLLLQKS